MNRRQTDPSRKNTQHFHAGERAGPWIAAAAALLTVAVFSPSFFTNTFISSPDSVLRLPLVAHYKHIPIIFTEEFMSFSDGRFRPLPYAVLALVRTFVAADNGAFWHLWLLAFHVANALLVYAIVRQFTERTASSLMALGVFLLHPVVSAFGNQMNLFHCVLGGTFYLGSLLCYLRYVQHRNMSLYVVGLVLFVCGLFSSLSVLTLPLLILLYEVFYRRTGVFGTVRRLLPFGVCMLAAGYFFLTFTPHPTFYVYPPRYHAGAGWYWLYSFAAGGIDRFAALVRGCSVPAAVTGLAGDFQNAWNALSILWTALLGACLILGVWGLLRKHYIGVGVFLLLLGVLPHFASPRNLTDDYASWSHRYLPLVGFALVAGALVDRLLQAGNRLWRRLVSVAAAAALIVYGGLLVLENVHARTPQSYWRHALDKNPNSEVASIELGEAYLAEGNEKEATEYLFSSIVQTAHESCLAMARHYSSKREPLAAIVHMQIASREDKYGLQLQESMLTAAQVLREAGAYDYAEQCLGQVLMANPYNTEALKRLAEILAAKGYLRAAVTCLADAAGIDPGDTASALRLAAFERRLYHPERYDASTKTTPPPPDWLRYATNQGRSIRIRDQLIRLSDEHPRDPVIQLTVSVCLSEEKRHDEALRRIDRALKVLPSHPYAWATKYWAAANAGKVELARETLKHVQNLKLRDAMTWHQLGYTLSKSGHYDLAVDCFRTALRANPKMYESHNNLALLLAQRGAVLAQRGEDSKALTHFREAVTHFRKALGVPEGKRAGVHNGLGVVLMHVAESQRTDRHFQEAEALLQEAVQHLNKSIAIDPKHPRAYHHLAEYYERQGEFSESIRVLSEGLEAIPEGLSLMANLAQLLSAAPHPRLRNGSRAVQLAEEVCRKGKPTPPAVLDILAAAYAETGRFDKAARTAARAANLARSQGNRELARYIEERRRLYLMHRPYRMPRPR